MRLVDGQEIDGKGGVADAEAVAQGTVAAGHDDSFHAGFDGSLHQVVGAEHVAAESGIKRQTFIFDPPFHCRMVGGPGLGTDVLDGVDPVYGPTAVVPAGQITADPRKLRKLGIGAATRH